MTMGTMMSSLRALDVPPPEPPLGPRVEHVLVDDERFEGWKASEVLAEKIEIPRDFAERLIRFGAVHMGAIPPAMDGYEATSALRAAAIARHGIRQPEHVRVRRLVEDAEVSYGAYVRAHIHPKRFGRVHKVSCRAQRAATGDPSDPPILGPILNRTPISSRRIAQVDWASTVLAQTAHFVVIDKPWGVSVPPSVDNLGECCVAAAGAALNAPLRITHRLDVGTSGVLVLAKTKAFAAYFNTRMASKGGDSDSDPKCEGQGSSSSKLRPRKRYRVLTARPVPLGLITHHAHTNVSERGRSERTVLVDAHGPGTKPCALRVHACVRLDSADHDHALYESEVELLTGRTHQIRAQMAACGAPVVGDTTYGEERTFSGGGEEGSKSNSSGVMRDGGFPVIPARLGLQAWRLEIDVAEEDGGGNFFGRSGCVVWEAGSPWWREET